MLPSPYTKKRPTGSKHTGAIQKLALFFVFLKGVIRDLGAKEKATA